MALISVGGDAKTTKGDNVTAILDGISTQFITGIIYMVPDEKLCPFASKGCSNACIEKTGRGVMKPVKTARQLRADFWHKNKIAFCAVLEMEIAKLERKALKKGKKLCLRLNGTSDIVWEQVRHFDGKNIFEAYPDIQFYDYTPNYMRFRTTHMAKNIPSNYHMTFSLKEDNKPIALKMLSEGHNVAVVFRKELPKQWHGYKVIDGDKHDLRFLDGQNVVVGLTAKGKEARNDVTGFVQDVEPTKQFNASMMQGAMA